MAKTMDIKNSTFWNSKVSFLLSIDFVFTPLLWLNLTGGWKNEERLAQKSGIDPPGVDRRTAKWEADGDEGRERAGSTDI